jgi:hypothetical protein
MSEELTPVIEEAAKFSHNVDQKNNGALLQPSNEDSDRLEKAFEEWARQTADMANMDDTKQVSRNLRYASTDGSE